ncbi:hypothetical protein BC830DRAFT_1117762 [Chytriomyces sp. MP71]|nr:hypothetical protein BC830DRAFT_1117762 [Chytriomyces sp. MP71]
MPLLYPEIFAGFQISAPRGVLFHGPPGTGKTLMARALASSCSTSTQKVAFFMRKGADVLSKWVGESERQLRLLFEEAKTYQPSIIFFDEIDGLAPVRSSKQDQIHASIVSTLLALMDGLDSRGQVVVIGATNRIDAIDPALRRPGRFDRELYFPLPSEPARKKIISITTSKWTPPIGEKLLDDLAKSTRGYCGADVRSLCTEAALNAVQRSFPEIYESSHKLEIDTKDIVVTAEDFAKSMKRIIPSTQRTSTVYSNPIPQHLRPLVQAPYADIIKSLDVLYPLLKQVAEASVTGFMAEAADGLPSSAPVSFIPSNYLSYAFSFQPRLLICGEAGMGQKILGPAALERLEVQNVYIQSLDLSTLLNDSSRSVDAAIIQLFHEMKRHRPAVLYIPDIDIWWESLSDVAKFVFVSLTERDPMNPVMVLATCEAQFDALPPELKGLIQGRFGSSSGIEGWKRVIVAQKPDKDARKQFFEELVSSVRKPATSTHSTGPQRTRKEPLKRATSPPPRELTEEETRALFEHDETLRRQLRLELRFIVTDIKRNKKFNDFLRPVDPDLFPDYYEVVAHPMDLETLLWNINNRRYSVLDEFIDDFECIIRSAEEYNQPDSAIVAKAYDLMDTFMSYITTLKTSEPQFVWELEQSALRCRLVNQQRRAKGLSLLGRERETIPGRRRGQRETVQDREEDEEESRKEGQKESEGHMETPPRTAMVGEEEGVAPSSASSKRNVRRVIDDSDNEEEVEGTSSVIGASSASVQSQTAFKNGVTEMKDEADKGDAMDTETRGSLTRDEVKEGAEAPVDAMVEEPRETIVQADDEDVEEDPLQKIFDLEEDVSVNAINADFIHTQDENILEVAIVVEEPQRELVVDEAALTAFARDLVDRTHGWSVSDLEALGVALSNVVLRHVNEWDREAMIQDLNGILGEAEKVWGKRDGM